MRTILFLIAAIIGSALAGCELCDQQPELCSTGAFATDDHENPGEAAVLPQDDRETFTLTFEWTPDVVRVVGSWDLEFQTIGNLQYPEDLESISISATCVDFSDGRRQFDVPNMNRTTFARIENPSILDPVTLTMDLTLEQREHLTLCQVDVSGDCSSRPDCIRSVGSHYNGNGLGVDTYTYGTQRVWWDDENEDTDKILKLDLRGERARFLYENPYAIDHSWRTFTMNWDGSQPYQIVDEDGQEMRRAVELEVPEWVETFTFLTVCFQWGNNWNRDVTYEHESAAFPASETTHQFTVPYNRRVVNHCHTQRIGHSHDNEQQWYNPFGVVPGHTTYTMDDTGETFDAVHNDGRDYNGVMWYTELYYHQTNADLVPTTLPPLAE